MDIESSLDLDLWGLGYDIFSYLSEVPPNGIKYLYSKKILIGEGNNSCHIKVVIPFILRIVS